MKKNSIIIVLLSILLCACSTTRKSMSLPSFSTMGLLTKNNWEYSLQTVKFKHHQLDSYHDNNHISEINMMDTIIIIGHPFYLSDSITFNFDSTRVGKITSGKYIIEYNTKANKTNVTEIQELNDTILILKAVLNPKELRIGGGYPVTYKAVKR